MSIPYFGWKRPMRCSECKRPLFSKDSRDKHLCGMCARELGRKR